MSHKKITALRDLYYSPVFSSDDGGWYVEVFDRNGKEILTTDVHPDRQNAINEAVMAINKKHAVD